MTSFQKPADERAGGTGATGGPPGTAPAPAPSAEDSAARTASDVPEGDSHAVTQAAMAEAFGGIRGMVETTVPGLVFVLVYTIGSDIKPSAIAALGVSVLLGLSRLITGGTFKHAFSGVFGVAIGVAFANMTGNAKDFYLPGLLYGLGLALAYILSTLAGLPLIGVILGPLFRENLSWRTRNPGRKKAYAKASWAWGLIFLAKSAILFPLYFWADPKEFGWVIVALKIPPLLLAVTLTYIFLKQAPPPIDVIAEAEAEEKAQAEREKSGRPAAERD
ncbi:DUF3159 domain-containing protein [Streptomyces sp. CMB-StM0423]|uniref:DUF3159 domain-containing protein n=1 Tax=Streptomyces sp. CMB-StM0423 TaxID=2059884 RepID=UPI000C708395|nr:DUF3159 domain-containing protein [Streptomyces sp. CMB-StM0423]AUH40053.1 DUF3159 domain-containing protein [Streptomyces sp. CMB-StM0423]